MLGFIVNPLGQKVPGEFPAEIQYSYSGAGEYLCPFDPQFNTRDQQGMYFDSMLGGPAIPTDAELAKVYGRTPVASSWIVAKEGYFPAPWRTPGGWNPAGKWGPPMSLSGASSVGWIAIGIQALAVVGAITVGKFIYHKVKK